MGRETKAANVVRLLVGAVCLLVGASLVAQTEPPAATTPPPTEPATPPAATPQPDTPPAPVPKAPEATPPAPTSLGGSVRGAVKSGSFALPGVTVTATNTLTGQKVTTTTDVDGTFSFAIPADGRWVIRAQMPAFANATQEVLIKDGARSAQADLEMMLLSRAEKAAQEAQKQQSAAAGRGFQSLSVSQGEGTDTYANGADQGSGASFSGINANAATESVAVSGTTSNPMGNMSSDAFRQRINEAREQGGGFNIPGGGGGNQGFGGGFGGPGGGGGAPFTFGGGGRGARGFDINKPHGTIYYTIGDSALDSAPFSLTGVPSTKSGYSQNRFGAFLGGPLKIPKIYDGSNKTFFFLNYNGTRGENPFDSFSTVPTLEERAGNFSHAFINTRDSSGNLIQVPVQIFDPTTNTQFPNNTLPGIDSAAAGLLAFIPTPNLPGDSQNFHFVTATQNNLDDLNFRLNRTLGGAASGAPRRGAGGPRNNLSVGIHYRGSSVNITNPFPSVGGSTDSRNFDIPVSYTRTWGKLTNIARFDFNRSRMRTENLYAFNQNVSAGVGIGGVSQDPFDWGLPGLSFTHFGSLDDTNPKLVRNQTFSFGDNLIWNHGKHTWRWGGDFRRIQLNTQSSSNAQGSFIFTGINTSQVGGDGIPVANTGFDLADFLLGLPQQTSVQCGVLNAGSAQCGTTDFNRYYFRGNSWDLYVQDEWKLRGNLTLNLGLRYEYVSPFTEVNGRIANLDLSPGFLDPNNATASVAVVLPDATGPFTGKFPATLMEPDRNNVAPRIGVAWKPFKKTVVRAGFGINYNTGAYSNIIQQLAFQPPFSVTQTNVQTTAGSLTLQNGFPIAPADVTNNYAVDKNYRLGYVQIWNLDIQHEIRPTLFLNLDYTGTKGNGLDILEAPNRDENGIRIPDVQAFNWETSNGSSTAHAGSLRIRKRLQNGISIGGTYTYSKSIDNASSIGGNNSVPAQDAFNLAAERGLSSFDQRHRFTADYLWELPFGHDRRWLAQSSVARAIFGDWNWSGDWTIASGLPFTPRVLGDFEDVARGTNGTLRPNLTGEPVTLSDPSIAEWFNTAAFVAPLGTQFGDARRNSIIGPGTLLFDMAFSKIIPLKESRGLEFRASASNIFNRPQLSAIDTVVNSPTFGQVVSAGAMRTIQLTARFRF